MAKKNNSPAKQKLWVRVLCLVLCVLLVAGVLTSVLVQLF